MPYANPQDPRIKRYRAVYYRWNKAKMIQNSAECMRRCRADVIRGYGGKCKCCGETHEEFLAIDHIHEDGAEARRRGERYCRLYRRLRREGYPTENYQLLCHNCNFAKSLRGGCPHGRTNGTNDR